MQRSERFLVCSSYKPSKNNCTWKNFHVCVNYLFKKCRQMCKEHWGVIMKPKTYSERWFIWCMEWVGSHEQTHVKAVVCVKRVWCVNTDTNTHEDFYILHIWMALQSSVVGGRKMTWSWRHGKKCWKTKITKHILEGWKSPCWYRAEGLSRTRGLVYNQQTLNQTNSRNIHQLNQIKLKTRPSFDL